MTHAPVQFNVVDTKIANAALFRTSKALAATFHSALTILRNRRQLKAEFLIQGQHRRELARRRVDSLLR